MLISIHAPVKGATCKSNASSLYGYISIHAPVKGATGMMGRWNGRWQIFQSTHPWRVRRGALPIYMADIVVFQSTHPWRVRRLISTSFSIHSLNFNPRTREGCDYPLLLGQLILKWFQSTHPWRVRQFSICLHHHSMKISIHAPVKGATTLQTYPKKQLYRISIHAPVKGATAFKLAQSLSALSSIILRADWKAVQFLSQLSGYCSFL